MPVTLTEVIDAVAHVGHNLDAQLLGLVALAMMMANEGDQTLGKTDEADAQGALVDDALDPVVGTQIARTVPQLRHEQRELLGHRGLLVLIAGIKLSGSDFQHVVQLGEKAVDALLLVLNVHALDGQTHNVDGRERQVAATDGGLFAKSVLKHAGAASHRGHLMLVALGIVGAPLLVVVVGGVQIDEIGEETPCSHLAGELIEVIVGVTGLVAHAGLLFPDLNGENGRGTVAHATISRFKKLADDATSLGTGVGAIVDGAEHDLVATARVDGVHVVDKGLHRLVDTAHGVVDGMLQDALVALQEIQLTCDVIIHFHIIQAAVVLPHQRLKVLDLLDEREAHVGSQIEVKRRNGLATVHLVLSGLHRDAGNDACSLDALGGARLAMTSHIALLEHLVQRVLHTGQALGGIVVLVMDVKIVTAHSISCLLA